MGSLQDIEEFAEQHTSCGTLTSSASSPVVSGYLLTLACACGATRNKWLTTEEAAQLPARLTPPAETTRPRSRRMSVPPRVLLPFTDESQQAHAGADTPAAPRPASEPATGGPSPAVAEPPRSRSVSASSVLAAPESPPTAAPPAAEGTPGSERTTPPPAVEQPQGVRERPRPRRMSLPPRVLLPLHDPPAKAPTAPEIATGSPPGAAQPTIEQPPPVSDPLSPRPPHAGRASAGSVPDAEATPATEGEPNGNGAGSEVTSLGIDRDTLAQAMQRALEDVQASKPRGRRPKPDKRALEHALRSALDAFDAETRDTDANAPDGWTPARDGEPGDQRRGRVPRRRRLTVRSALVIAAVLFGATALWWAAHLRATRSASIATPGVAVARAQLTDADRTALTQVMSTLRELETVSRPDVPYRVYFNRVSFAKADVDRYLLGVTDFDLRRAVQQALALHVLAANAWRAKTLNERDKWESIGDDPNAEACPAARRMLIVGDEPPSMSRSQWRGMTLAVAIPHLWDCAAERLNEIDKSLGR